MQFQIDPNDPNSHLIKGIEHVSQGRNQCGAASLSIVFRYYGKSIPLSEIDSITRKTFKFGHPDVMVQYALDQGYEAKRIPISDFNIIKAYIKKDIPVIVLTKYNPKKLSSGHWVVLIGYNSNGFIIQDPDKGRIFSSYKKFDQINRYYKTSPSLGITIYTEEMLDLYFDQYGNILQ